MYMQIPGFLGRTGLISPIHGKFCQSCNRLRLTSTGKLKYCLCYDDAEDLRSVIRSGETPEEKQERIRKIFVRRDKESRPGTGLKSRIRSVRKKDE